MCTINGMIFRAPFCMSFFNFEIDEMFHSKNFTLYFKAARSSTDTVDVLRRAHKTALLT